MPTTITVKRVWRNPGTSKKTGKPYTLTKLLADGKYYTTFQSSSIISSIQEGSIVELEAVPSKREGCLDIARIIGVDAVPKTTQPANAGTGNTTKLAAHANPQQADVKPERQGSSGSSAGRTSETLPAAPVPLTLQQLDAMLKASIESIHSQDFFNGMDDDVIAQVVAARLRGALQAQSQGFQLAMNALEWAQKEITAKRWNKA